MKESEEHFLQDADKSFIVSLGLKRSGKTYLMLQYLKLSLQYDTFQEYHLVLPQFGFERDGAYQFLSEHKNKVFIYDRYHELITKKVLEEMKTKHLCFVVDDATGEFTQGGFDSYMSKLLTVNEHGKTCCVWLCIHGTRKVLPPLARAMLNYLFIYTNDDGPALKKIWEDRFSRLYPKFEDFAAVYDKAMSMDHNAIMYALNRHHELEGILDWDLTTMKFKNVKESTKIKPITIDERKVKIDTKVERIEDKQKLKKKIDEQQPKKSNISFSKKGVKFSNIKFF